ncbi:branched-chain amino acid ABC transporter permease [Streptomyces asiaticus]|uniref:branched-chain amino acid ABC transporter permease n=1 Tax=Streptomyces asiaticus TaxID=114695 RepID=UPI003D745B0D
MTAVKPLAAAAATTGRAPSQRIGAVKRLAACLFAGIVLAMMVGPQEGSESDYGLAFRESVLRPRIAIFLGIGLALFVVVSYWDKMKPRLARPGLWPLASGAMAVTAAITLLHWCDGVGDGKFAATAEAVARTPGIAPVTAMFFGWLAWTMAVVISAVGFIAAITGQRILAVATAAAAVAAGVVTYLAHRALNAADTIPDHSLGHVIAILGYLVIASSLILAAATDGEQARARALVMRALGFRPGLPLVLVGAMLTLVAFVDAAWFSPSSKDTNLAETHALLHGSSLSGIASNYLGPLSWVLFACALSTAAASTWLRHRLLGWAACAIGFASAALTLVTLHDISQQGAKIGLDGATGPWQNLGAGGWMACAGLFILGSAGLVVATVGDVPLPTAAGRLPTPPQGWRTAADGTTSSSTDRTTFRVLSAPGTARSLVLIVVAVALFYPPTASPFWQQVLVSEIGIAMLLAIGLNVVIGWAGLLDLGFIAFYAIGSYTTGYLVGALPIKPPSWLHMTPLLSIPFAIVACLIAGVILGVPTLRLRGDYLAIVTLGFGEIIHLVAVNSKSITNGSEGLTNDSNSHTTSVPNPSIHVGPVHLDWGLAPLQYWYLLLTLLVVIILAFRRLEYSRLGRAWAAVREDEMAARATGVNTTKVKLAAFAVGASTSGVAGVFFASQVGTVTPDNFVLNNSILIVAYVVFGGIGSLGGALAGAAALTWLPEFLKTQVPAADRPMWIGAVVLLMMVFRPGGVLPARRRAAELSSPGTTPTTEPSVVTVSEGP